MNMNAFNALLKSLEEPAKDTHLILICNQMQNVPLTIRSRCQLLRLATPNAIDCIEWLDKTTADPAQSASLLAIAGGLPLLAEQLFLNGAADEYLARGIALKQLSDGQVRIAEVVELWSDDTTGKFLDFLGENLQYIVSTLPAAQLKTAQVHTIFRLLDEVYVLQRAINAGANPNKSLLLMSILSKYRRLLGTCLLGDNIPTRTGDTSV